MYYIACDDNESFIRTFSLMVALGTAKYIVTSRWIIESFEAKKFFRSTIIFYLTVSHKQNMDFQSVLLL